ncbi:MAG: hypothetical protein Kow0025_21070 [Thermodesulfovibrionales bacterium]
MKEPLESMDGFEALFAAAAVAFIKAVDAERAEVLEATEDDSAEL